MTMFELLQKIASTSKLKEKEAILREHENTEIGEQFKRVAFLALDPRHNFNIIDYEEPDVLCESADSITLDEAIDIIESKLLNEGVRGNAAKNILYDIGSKLSSENRHVIKCIIDRSLKCGMGTKTINNVFTDLVYEHPYRRCTAYSSKAISVIKLPAISQLKEDGMYVDIVVHDGKVEYRSRTGGYHNWHIDRNDKQLKHEAPESVLMGEALVLADDGKSIMPRKDGNGYLNGEDVDPERIVFSLWDIIPYDQWIEKKSTQPYSETLSKLSNVVERLGKSFRIVDTRVVETVEDIVSHFKSNIAEGLEGSVVKNLDSVWKNGTSKDWVKIKVVFDVDLEVYEVYEGNEGKKYEGMAGGLRARTSDNRLSVDVGTGLSDQQRKEFFAVKEDIVGKIITVRACDISLGEDGLYTLMNPRLEEVRNDKFIADSLERVEAQKQASIDALNIIN